MIRLFKRKPSGGLCPAERFLQDKKQYESDVSVLKQKRPPKPPQIALGRNNIQCNGSVRFSVGRNGQCVVEVNALLGQGSFAPR